jgi:hypothetical protein
MGFQRTGADELRSGARLEGGVAQQRDNNIAVLSCNLATGRLGFTRETAGKAGRLGECRKSGFAAMQST